MKRILIALALIIPVSASAQMKQINFDARTGNGMVINQYNQKESGVVFLPRTYDSLPGKSWPLIISDHGRDQASKDLVLSALFTNGLPLNIIRDKLEVEAIVISVQDQWSTPAPAQVNYAVQNIIKTYRVDTNRIYATGYSYGGGPGALAMAITYPYIAAVMSLSPAPLQDSSYQNIPRLAKNNTPVAFWYQKNDPGTPSEADVLSYSSALQKAGGSGIIVLGTPAGSHGPWDGVYNRKVLFDGKPWDQWLFQYSRKSVTPPVTTPPVTVPPVTTPTRKALFKIIIYDNQDVEKVAA